MKREGPYWTFILMGVCVIAFIIQQITPLWIYLAFFPAFALSMPWMFVTSIFLHADITHLMLNMLALFFFGITLEGIIGRSRFLVLFLASGIVGNIGYMLTATNPMIPAIGASGAVYGIIGTVAVLMPFRLVYIYGILPVPMVVAAAMWAFIDITGLFMPTGIAHGAHLAGMVVGIIYGFYIRSLVKRRRRSF